jgi:hypothetical protein
MGGTGLSRHFTFAPEAYQILEISRWVKGSLEAHIKTRWEWGIGALTVPDGDKTFDEKKIRENRENEWKRWSDGFDLENPETWIETEDAVLSEAFLSHDVDGTATLKILGWREMSSDLFISGPLKLAEIRQQEN